MPRNDKRVKITLECTECKRRNYITTKSKINDRERLEMKKYCNARPPSHQPQRDQVAPLQAPHAHPGPRSGRGRLTEGGLIALATPPHRGQ